jgi:hypothetical protein
MAIPSPGLYRRPGLPAPAFLGGRRYAMPRKGSKERSQKTVARWLADRCSAKWQCVIVPKNYPELEREFRARERARGRPFYAPCKYERLIDRFITPEGPPDEKRILDLIDPTRTPRAIGRKGALSDSELSDLAEVAATDFQLPGRPWDIPLPIPWEIPSMNV